MNTRGPAPGAPRHEETTASSVSAIAFTAIAAGGLVLYAGALALIATAIIALAEVMEPWLAALIVGVLVTALGGFLLYYGYNQLKNLDMTPRRTVETLQENAEWLKREVS